MTMDSDHVLRLVRQDEPHGMCSDAMSQIHVQSTLAEDLAFVRQQKVAFSLLSQGTSGWVRDLVERCVGIVADSDSDADVRAACLVLTMLVTLNADVIEEHMARALALGLRVV